MSAILAWISCQKSVRASSMRARNAAVRACRRSSRPANRSARVAISPARGVSAVQPGGGFQFGGQAQALAGEVLHQVALGEGAHQLLGGGVEVGGEAIEL